MTRKTRRTLQHIGQILEELFPTPPLPYVGGLVLPVFPPDAVDDVAFARMQRARGEAR